MTDKLHCPFCGAELEKEQGSERWWYCVNAKCVHKYTTTHETIWQAIIDGKAAQDALKFAVETLHYIASGESSEWEDSTITAMKAIKEITSITTQELDK